MFTPYSGDLIEELTRLVEKAEDPPYGPQFAHEHICCKCGLVCYCDWNGCGPNEADTMCLDCANWAQGRV
jgi:hypothetical protein